MSRNLSRAVPSTVAGAVRSLRGLSEDNELELGGSATRCQTRFLSRLITCTTQLHRPTFTNKVVHTSAAALRIMATLASLSLESSRAVGGHRLPKKGC